jgi:GNAT superfamily N-acetyltransferase
MTGDAAMWRRMLHNMRAFFAFVADCAPDGRLIQVEGVTASVVPAAPDRSVVNSVVYEDAEALGRVLDLLASEYERAGVRAWTVWVPEDDRAPADLLERAGHLLDANPAAMTLELEGYDAAAAPQLDLDPEPSIAEAARINDAAYGFAGDFERAFVRMPPDRAHLYLARLDSVPAATLAAVHHGGDCGIYLVATRPEARGRGLASALMTRALADAREAGCTTSSLQATRAGEPIYARLGYRRLGELHMWERRRAP